MRLPIRIQLTAAYCAVFCLGAILLEIGTYAALVSSMFAVVDNELQGRLHGVEGFLDEHIDRKPLPQLRSELTTHAALKPDFLEIERVGEGEMFRGRFMAGFPDKKRALLAVYSAANTTGLALRILSARRIIKGQQYDLCLAADLAVPSAILSRFRWLVFFSSPVVIAFAAIAGYWISKRALLPVSRLTIAARSIGAANLSERVAVPRSGDEVQDLAETLNGMLGRIDSAFRRVTQFTANASHELRAPLALIRTTSEVALLRVNGNAGTYREALHRILREAEKNSVVLDDMLRLARADASAIALALEPVEFGPHIEELYERVLPLAREKNIRLDLQASRSRCWVMVDPGHLRRLWLILLDNAIKYTPAGGSIVVSWQALSPGALVCEVRDSGIGISESDLPHIFERFYRADKARNRDDGGAGLGLAIARWIVDAHRATIEVASVPGQGSTFRVVLSTLPRPKDSAPAAEPVSDSQTQDLVSK